MRHLLFLFALALCLAACDDATTAPAETIPGPGENPRLSVTVLTGTKAAPVDSPTVKVQWWYKDSIAVGVYEKRTLTGKFFGQVLKGSGDIVVKLNCRGSDSLGAIISATDPYTGIGAVDSVQVYCKAP